jgi:hypothetical protein
MALPLSSFSVIREFIDTLETSEVKPCITLVRYGIIPTPSDKILWNTIPVSLFNKLFSSYDKDPEFTEEGSIFFQISTNPLISSTIISLCLAKVPSASEIETSFLASVSKEVQVMESTARQPSINWKIFFEPTPGSCFILPHQGKDATHFAFRLHNRFKRFRDSIAYSRIWPHGTSRGISRSAQLSLRKLREEDDVSWMQPEDHKRQMSSLDVVKHYIRTGHWATGSCELRQKWYPAQLAPRTYFAQGGDAIRVSSYLRNFFNDFTDTYLPTERRARVDGSRLICPSDGYFFIYDLISFTSNFHEQMSFLTSMASFFKGTTVFCIGPGLNLIEDDLGDMIEGYCMTVNFLPTFEYKKEILDFSLDSVLFFHHVAGFLGVPGNLATCTLAHGISIGISVQSDDRQSCAGDDGNLGLKNDSEEMDAKKTLHLLGSFNDDKASSTRDTGRGSYLKRPFKQSFTHGDLTERVDFPLMGAVNVMQQDDPRFPDLSNDRSVLRKGIAASVSKLFRDLYAHSQGYYTQGVLEYILFFLKEVYAKGMLPTSGMVRGFYGSDLDRESFKIDAAVVFPLSERYFRRDPDLVLTEDFLPWVVEVPVWTDETIHLRDNEEWSAGDTRVGKSSSVLEKLVKLGYLERRETERITLVGEEARRHFRRYTEDDFRRQEYCYTALCNLSKVQIASVGLSGLGDSQWRRLFYETNVAIPLRQGHRYRDLDETIDNDISPNFSEIGDMY